MLDWIIWLGAILYTHFGILVGAFFLLLIFGAIWAIRDQKRSISMLAEQECPFCGEKFGQEAALQAPQNHQAECQKIRLANPGSIISFIQQWPVECAICHKQSDFDYHEGRLVNHEAI